MFASIKSFFKNKINSIKRFIIPTSIMASLASVTPFVFAVTPTEIIKALLNSIFTIALYIGILLLVWGVIILVLAIRNEDADSKSRAVLFIVVAIVLICLGALFDPIFNLVVPGGYTSPK